LSPAAPGRPDTASSGSAVHVAAVSAAERYPLPLAGDIHVGRGPGVGDYGRYCRPTPLPMVCVAVVGFSRGGNNTHDDDEDLRGD